MSAFVDGRRQLVVPEEYKKALPPLGGGLRGNVVFGISYGTCSSSLQKAVRRGMDSEAVQWALGMHWKSSAAQTNLWNRMLVMAVEDVGPANILALPSIYALWAGREDGKIKEEHRVAMAAGYLAQSPKSRINDWAAYYHISKGDEVDKVGVQSYYSSYLKALKAKDLPRILTCITDLAFYKKDLPDSFRKAWGIKKKWPQILIWEGFEAVAPGNKYLALVKSVAMLKSWNTKAERAGKTRLLYSHVAVLWAMSDFEELDAYAYSGIDEKKGAKAVKARVSQVLKMEELYGVPDYAMDKHTVEGKRLKRGMKHFVEEASYLANESEEWKEASSFYREVFKKNQGV